MNQPPTKPKDRRLIATFAIMGSALGMLALCIPLCMITDNDTLPLWTIGAAALSTVAVWAFGRPTEIDTRQSRQIAELENVVGTLNERLEHVEVINRFEAELAKKSAEEPDSSPHRSMGPISE